MLPPEALEHDPAKWITASPKKIMRFKEKKSGIDSIRSDPALAARKGWVRAP
jgi:hypothetical protein